MPAVAISLFIALAGLAVWHFRAASSPSLPSRIDETIASRHVTAVLPFAVADEEPRLRKIADRVGDEIAEQLARDPGMRSIGRRTTESLGVAELAPGALASKLHAAYAVSGRAVPLPGAQGAVIDVEMLALPDGAVIGAAHFDVETSSGAATAADVGELVTNLVRGKAGEIEMARATAPGHTPDATDLVVIGWEELTRLTSLEDTLRARARFQEALRQDPDSVRALTGLAAAYLQAKIRRMPLTPADNTEFEATLEHALKRAPNDPTTALVWAIREQLEGRPELAIPAIEKANRLMPSSPNGHFMLGLSLIRVGRLDEAQPELDRALRLALLGNDPRRASNAYTASAEIALMRGNDALAAELARRSIAMRPADAGGANAYAVLAAAEALAGNQKEAEAAMAIFRRRMPNESIANYDAKSPSQHPAFLAQRTRLYEGLHRAGLPE